MLRGLFEGGPNMKRVLPILVALILAGVAAFGIQQWAQRMGMRGDKFSVVVATRDLREGDTLRQTDLQAASIYAPQTGANPGFWTFVFEDYVRPENMGTLTGRAVNREIKAGFPVLRSMLRDIRKERNIRDWKTDIGKDRRGISIPVENIAAVSGLIQVGDHVDILVTVNVPQKNDKGERVMTMPVQMGQSTQQVKIPMRNSTQTKPMTFYLLQNVELLAVGHNTQPPELVADQEEDVFKALTKQEQAGGSVTVAVTPQQAMLFAFVNTAGESEYMLALRRPGDTNVLDQEIIRPADFDVLLEAVGVKK